MLCPTVVPWVTASMLTSSTRGSGSGPSSWGAAGVPDVPSDGDFSQKYAPMPPATTITAAAMAIMVLRGRAMMFPA